MRLLSKIAGFGVAVAASIVLAGPAAAAVTYDAVADFHGGPNTGIWTYGTGVGGVSFTAMTDFSAICEGAAGISCWQTPTPIDRVPLVAKNSTGTTQYIYGTVVQPDDVLNVHPGPSSDAIVRFTAPTTSTYNISGFFQTLDTNPNGVNIAGYLNDVFLEGTFFQGAAAVAPSTAGGTIGFGGALHLTAGDHLDFVVNRAGSYYNDSTGLSATLTAVPEPAAWALMIAGFGGVGVMIRRRNRLAAFA